MFAQKVLMARHRGTKAQRHKVKDLRPLKNKKLCASVPLCLCACLFKTLCLCAFVFLCLAFAGCKKKDRLSVTTALIKVSPAAMAVSLDGTQTFTATGVSASGDNFSVSPTWTLNPASGIGSLNTNTGSSVVFTAVAFGTATLRAATSDLVGEAQVRINSAAPGAGAILTVYNDNGLPQGKDSNIFMWQDGGTSANTLVEITDTYAPEGIKYQRATRGGNAGWVGWGIVICQSVTAICQGENLSSFSTAGQLKFNLRMSRPLAGSERFKVEVEDINHVEGVNNRKTTPAIILSSSHGFNSTSAAWQEVFISGSVLLTGNLDASKVRLPFEITAENVASSLTFDVDNVRWEQ